MRIEEITPDREYVVGTVSVYGSDEFWYVQHARYESIYEAVMVAALETLREYDEVCEALEIKPHRLAACLSSEKMDWGTPRDLAARMVAKYGITLDVCASPENAVVPKYFTYNQDGLAQFWDKEVCWMNPPYGKELPLWIDKAVRSARNGATVVCLVPARTDTKWWRQLVDAGAEIQFLPGRLKFMGAENPAPFPSAIVVLRPKE